MGRRCGPRSSVSERSSQTPSLALVLVSLCDDVRSHLAVRRERMMNTTEEDNGKAMECKCLF